MGQLPGPFLLLGYKSGRHLLWGDTYFNPKENQLFPLLKVLELMILKADQSAHPILLFEFVLLLSYAQVNFMLKVVDR